jgi:outer membrane protein OmpA-like peptidoglycan-associated protein
MKSLAQGRAQEVRRYLMTRWGIDGARIRLSTSAAPAYPSSAVYGEGMQENRRVEIFTSSDELLQPLIFERFSEYAIDPGSIGFTASAGSAEGIREWKIEVNAGDRPLMVRQGTSAPPSTLDWRLDTENAEQIVGALGSTVGGLQGVLTVADASGRQGRARMDIPVVVEQNPFEISRLSLVVFDFDRSEIGTQNRRMISSFLSRSISPSSSSSIVGSTDRLGEVEHNQQLSTQRAFAVRDVILAERPDATITGTEGVGPSRLPYDNDLPEGRYYCRTVAVEMKTPLAEVTER